MPDDTDIETTDENDVTGLGYELVDNKDEIVQLVRTRHGHVVILGGDGSADDAVQARQVMDRVSLANNADQVHVIVDHAINAVRVLGAIQVADLT